MTGKDLYEKWRQKMEDHGVGTDPYDTLDLYEQQVWDELVEELGLEST